MAVVGWKHRSVLHDAVASPPVVETGDGNLLLFVNLGSTQLGVGTAAVSIVSRCSLASGFNAIMHLGAIAITKAIMTGTHSQGTAYPTPYLNSHEVLI